MSVEELNEGEPIVPKARQLWRDAARWKVLKVEGEEEDACVTFMAGSYMSSDGVEMPVTFRCYKSGMIYKEWEKEFRRREAGETVAEPQDFQEGTLVQTFVRQEVAKKPFEPVVRLIDSQLEERQYRLNEMRKKFRELDWGDEKDRLLSEIVALEKKVLGDPC